MSTGCQIGLSNVLGKSAISSIAMTLSVSLYVYVSVCVTFVSTGRILTKIKNIKITFIDFDICH